MVSVMQVVSFGYKKRACQQNLLDRLYIRFMGMFYKLVNYI